MANKSTLQTVINIAAQLKIEIKNLSSEISSAMGISDVDKMHANLGKVVGKANSVSAQVQKAKSFGSAIAGRMDGTINGIKGAIDEARRSNDLDVMKSALKRGSDGCGKLAGEANELYSQNHLTLVQKPFVGGPAKALIFGGVKVK